MQKRNRSMTTRLIFNTTGKVAQQPAVTKASIKPNFQRPEA
jgi:hypothetical protein